MGADTACNPQLRRTSSAISDKCREFDIPEIYIRPPSDRPTLRCSGTSTTAVPQIDLSRLEDAVHARQTLNSLVEACRRTGIFQVVNHRVDQKTVAEMLRVAREFFSMSAELRQHLRSEDPAKTTRLSTSFNINKERVHNWREYLRLHCYPLHKYTPSWPSNPPDFVHVTSTYCTEIRALVLRLLRVLSQGVGLSPDFLENALGEHAQHMAINYYAPCPNPELTYGLPKHTDPNALTVLLTDSVPGLQALTEDGEWVAVEPLSHSFVVIIGNQIEVLSNGVYKSAVHRAVVNAQKARISIPTFYCPSANTEIEPAELLVTEKNPRRFKKFRYEEYYKTFWSNSLESDTLQDFTLS
eukprot:TRINITY_DN7917_c0_g1_i1.p1 TRINITY_DN7917_c0_g1~~TRINITY_DN7917_c0_g1_i1.p1  ORF type:complete len:355 (+),score=-9.09 TRINITY_DN7917_c0_g1_i1:102-1166(+)